MNITVTILENEDSNIAEEITHSFDISCVEDAIQLIDINDETPSVIEIMLNDELIEYSELIEVQRAVNRHGYDFDSVWQVTNDNIGGTDMYVMEFLANTNITQLTENDVFHDMIELHGLEGIDPSWLDKNELVESWLLDKYSWQGENGYYYIAHV